MKAARSRWSLAGLLLAAAASRIPLLGHGFGSDDDAWRNAVAALRMGQLGEYVPSRIPGFPVFEGLLVPTVPLGWVASNALSIVAGLVAVIFFYRVAQVRSPKNAFWLAVAFCFSAPLWVHASQTMDYAVGLAFLMAAYDALVRRRYGWAAVLLALAGGCRPTLGFLASAAGLWLLVRGEKPGVYLRFVIVFAVTEVVIFLPVLMTPEAATLGGELAGHMDRNPLVLSGVPGLLRRTLVYLFTKPGLVILALGLGTAVVRRGFLRQAPAAPVSERGAPAPRVPVGRPAHPGALPGARAGVFELAGIVILSGFYLLVPYEPAYLIPILPLILLGAGSWLTRRWVLILALAMASESLVIVYVDTHRVLPGRLFQEVETRRYDLAETRALSKLRPEEPTIYLVGRFATHRLLLLDDTLEPAEPAWAPFYASGVALLSGDGRWGFASDLNEEDQADLERAGFQIVDLRPEP